MMKLKILFSFFLFLNVGWAKTGVSFTSSFLSDDKVEYVSNEFEKPICVKTNNCQLFLGQVSDGFHIILNDNILIDESQSYLNFTSTVINIPNKLFEQKNKIKVVVYNKNRLVMGLRASEHFIASSHEVRIFQSLDWFKRTGVTLASIYALLIFCMFFFALLLISYRDDLLLIFIYCVISVIYLISFSEIPRYFFSPEVFSGAVHFPLRLLQDCILFLLFNRFLNKDKIVSNKVVSSLGFIYLCSICLMVFPAISGKTEMHYHLAIIKVAAPLVALPMGYAFLLSLKNRSLFERKILIPSTLTLFIFQLNDLLMFWRVINTYYTVKFYIPFIIAILIFIFLYRRMEENKSRELLAAKSQVIMQVAHDIKSPVAAINTATEYLDSDKKMAKEILALSVERLNSIIQTLLPGHNKIQKFNLVDYIEKVINEKKYDVSFSRTDSIFIEAKKVDIQRLVSNLLDNAYEAANSNEIEVKLETVKNDVVLSVIDSGPGIPKTVLDNIGKIGNTVGKENGSGYGLSFMVSVINEHNAKYNINTDESGTKIDLTFRRV